MTQNKNMKEKIITFITKTVLFFIFYFANYYILKTINCILDKTMSIRSYSLPILIIFSISYFTQFAFQVSEKFYSLIYYVSCFFLGLDLQAFFIVSCYKFISLFIYIPQKIALFICIVLPVIISIYAAIKARIIYIENINITFNKNISNKIKIVQLSDLHLGVLYQKNYVNEVVNKIKENCTPDVIVITGDLFDNNSKPKVSWLEPLNYFKDICPILYVTGNHERLIGKKQIIDIIKQTNINFIGDNSESVTIKENYDFYGFCADTDVSKKVENLKIDDNKVNILLGHYPFYNPKTLQKVKIDLFLAGHTHGGQVFPIHLIESKMYQCFSGLYEENQKYVYVSQGLGCVIFPMRFFADSTIPVITINGQNK